MSPMHFIQKYCLPSTLSRRIRSPEGVLTVYVRFFQVKTLVLRINCVLSVSSDFSDGTSFGVCSTGWDSSSLAMMCFVLFCFSRGI
jgi:hypothetical protein